MNIEVWFAGKKIEDLSELKKIALSMARDAGRICYSEKDLSEINKEENKDKLTQILIKSGHHSPFDHAYINLYIKNIPKIGAMILNNEKVYATSEKSARYTIMEMKKEEEEIFYKWKKIIESRIAEKYPNLDELKISKLAQENARYFTSVFTPAKMLYSVSFRQINYLMHWFKKFIENSESNAFNDKLKEFMIIFNEQLSELYVEDLNPIKKFRKLSLFSDRNNFTTEFNENYSVSYKISFACLAQAHRHRTINYEIFNFDKIVNLNDVEFFVPPIVEDLKENWLEDMDKLKENFPQGMLIDVHEFGNYKDFISKAGERICGHAQLEVMKNTVETLNKYAEKVEKNSEVSSIFSNCVGKARCKFPNGCCESPCPFGPDKALKRII